MSTSPPFAVSNWYWNIGGDTTRAYSSAVGDYVLSSDPAFQSWLARNNNLAAKVDTEDSLAEVLAKWLDQLKVKTSTVLVIQQALKQAQLDALLLANADIVHLVQGGQSSTTTGTAVANYLSNATNNYRSLRAQIAAATSAAAVQAININAGWPPNP